MTADGNSRPVPRSLCVVDVTPSARRLTWSLRDMGYDFTAAVADIVDNSVTAGARRITVDIVFEGAGSWVRIADDGSGMTGTELNEAMRYGSRREYGRGELGRFGLGLKTASLSQCRRVTVATRGAGRRRPVVRCLDLDHVQSVDRWEVIEPLDRPDIRLLTPLREGTGTVVVWDDLDRVVGDRPDGGWARRRIGGLADRTSSYLGMVLHRFLAGGVDGRGRLDLRVNGEPVDPWDPLAPAEPRRLLLPPKTFEITQGGSTGAVTFRPCVLPPRQLFSTPTEFERLGGPLKWNRQQGLYIYRANRMIQSGGWSWLRAADEHTKLARASLDFDTDLDDVFQTNVSKMRVGLPPQLRPQLEKSVVELCREAEAVYRSSAATRAPQPDGVSRPMPSGDVQAVGLALRMAALELGELAALGRIATLVGERSPEVLDALGWQDDSEELPVVR